MTRYTTRATELVAAVALGAVMASAGGEARAQAAATLELEPCRLEHPNGLGSVAARCGRLSVPEDYGAPEGRRIEGEGVVPDETVPLRRAELLAGRDAALEAAVAWASTAPAPVPGG